MSTKYGWCMTGHCNRCPGQLTDKQVRYPPAEACGCECHQREESK